MKSATSRATITLIVRDLEIFCLRREVRAIFFWRADDKPLLDSDLKCLQLFGDANLGIMFQEEL